ncbi:MAG: insulinase family protein [Oscillospiraceae bacterium]|nr:insulinase family protein [Oscillospiraceae bacterium]
MEKKIYKTLGETLYTAALPNGLTVYVIPKPGYEKKYAFFATSYGGADRRFQQDGEWQNTPAGIAHFLEHKLFDTEAGNALADLAANGAQPNAFTSSEMTAYYFECTDGFEENLKTLLSFVSTPYFTEESVAKEQGIIGQEIGMIEDTPGHAVYYNLLKALYANHPVRDMISGTVESIAQITAQTLYDLHRAFYRPGNMVLCAVGDIDPEQVAETARAILPEEYHASPTKDYGPSDTMPVIQARTEVAMAVSQPLFLLGTRVPPSEGGQAYLKRELTGHLATQYLAGKSSPLYVRLYAEGLIAKDFSCGFLSGLSHAITEFGGESRDPDKVLAEMQAEAVKVLSAGIDESRFIRLKKATSGQLIRGLDNVENLCYEQTESHFHGASALDRLAVLEAITSADVLDFIGKHLQPDQFALSIVRPL